MPQFKKLSAAEIKDVSRRRSNLEGLEEYVSYLKSLRAGDWGEIQLGAGETSRSVKRRTSVAASSQGKKLRWRRSPSPERLVFQVIPRG